jgi:hypothetical protein
MDRGQQRQLDRDYQRSFEFGQRGGGLFRGRKLNCGPLWHHHDRGLDVYCQSGGQRL